MNEIRKCDSRCHNAKGKRCKCWCQGRHHGLGAEKASEIFFEDFINSKFSHRNGIFVMAKSPELELGFNESKMPTGKKKVAQ